MSWKSNSESTVWVENRISVWDLLENLFWKKFQDAIAEAGKPLVPYFEVLHAGFVKRPCDANLVFCSCVLGARMMWKNWIRLANKMFIDQQTIT